MTQTQTCKQAFCAVCRRAVELPHACLPGGIKTSKGKAHGSWREHHDFPAPSFKQ